MSDANFFFDTADVNYIEQAWDKLKAHFKPSEVAGITTNPNAMAKVGATSTVADHLEQTRKLADCLNKINPDGVLYVQVPNSKMYLEDALQFAKLHKEAVEGKCNIGIKISPNVEYLRNIDRFNELELRPNVTGLADCATALLCLSYPVEYISIIPGRMEEKQLDATAHLLFLASRNPDRKGQVIAGSMRTLDGLERSIVSGTVPTIGTRVFDQILPEESVVERFRKMWNLPLLHKERLFNKATPLILDENKELSRAFFEQMDELGDSVFQDFYRR